MQQHPLSNMQVKLKVTLLPLFLFALTIYTTYQQLPDTFFQQDEWSSFGAYIQREKTGGIIKVILESSIASGKIHVNPLTAIGEYIQFKLFSLNFPGYAYISILLHFINTVLIYYFSRQLVKRRSISFFAALLFGINSISHQAVTWVSGSIQTQGALVFSLLFAILFLKQRIYLAYLSIFAALLFKESAAAFILLAPLLWWLYSGKINFTRAKRVFTPFLLFGIIYLVLRLIIFFLAPKTVIGQAEVQLQPPVSAYLYRAATLPFKGIAQSVFSASQLISWADTVVDLAYPQFITGDGIPNPFISQSIVFGLVNYVLTVLIVSVSLIVYKSLRKSGEMRLANGVIFSLALIAVGALPLVFIPGKAGYFSIFEPRHLYMGMFGAGLLQVVVAYKLAAVFAKEEKTRQILSGILLLPLVLIHAQGVHKDIEGLKQIGQLRKSFLVKIQEDYSSLPERVIFYTESDRSYYGMPDETKILPVQVGFGRMLLVWYHHSENFPACMFEGRFLADLRSQGYRECGGRGFGYFREFTELEQELVANDIPSDKVVAYSWDGETEQFKNITQEIRMKLTSRQEPLK